MQKKVYSTLFNVEKNHWWYKGMRDITSSLLGRFYEHNIKAKKIKMLDAGCGTGYTLYDSPHSWTKIGIDISMDALSFSKKRGQILVRGDLMNLPFEDNTFDVIYSLDVIYHKWITSDVLAIKELKRVLKPKGVIIIRVPAFDFLRRDHDYFVMTRQRYTKKELSKLLLNEKLKISKITYSNFFLFFFVLANRYFVSNKKDSDIQKIPGRLINLTLHLALKFEAFLLKYVSLPFGTSIICIATK